MSVHSPNVPLGLVRTDEAARLLGLSRRTLEKHRTYSTGPRYLKLGGRVVYKVDDLKAWSELGCRNSTSDPGTGTVLPAKRHAQGATIPKKDIQTNTAPVTSTRQPDREENKLS
jgi:predicted DNA-binding transcriptional regulator AlpA